MNKLYFLLFFSLFCQLSFSKNINPEDLRQVDRLLENIIRESKTLPQQKQERIISNVLDIKQILFDRSQDYRPRPNEYHNRENNRIRPEFRTYEEVEMQDLKARIKNAWPYRDQLIFLRRVSRSSAFTMKQILEISKVIDFPNDQREIALMLAANVIDPENVDLLYDLFVFQSDREKLYDVIDRNQR